MHRLAEALEELRILHLFGEVRDVHALLKPNSESNRRKRRRSSANRSGCGYLSIATLAHHSGYIFVRMAHKADLGNSERLSTMVDQCCWRELSKELRQHGEGCMHTE